MTVFLSFADSDIRCIEVFHQNGVTDFLFTLPFLHNLRREFPKARIISVIRPHLADLWQISGQGDEMLIRQESMPLTGKLYLARVLRKRRPDITFLLNRSIETMSLARMSRSPVRVGFKGQRFDRMLTHKVSASSILTGPKKPLQLLEAIGIQPVKQDYLGLLRPPAGESRRMLARLNRMGFSSIGCLIALAPHTGSGDENRRWTPEGWVELANHFLANPGVQVAVIGAAAMPEITEKLNAPFINLTGRMTLRDAAVLLAMANLTISVDTGLMHISAAVGVPTLALMRGPEHSDCGPMGTGHRILCPQTGNCLLELNASTVIQTAQEMLSEPRGWPGPAQLVIT